MNGHETGGSKAEAGVSPRAGGVPPQIAGTGGQDLGWSGMLLAIPMLASVALRRRTRSAAPGNGAPHGNPVAAAPRIPCFVRLDAGHQAISGAQRNSQTFELQCRTDPGAQRLSFCSPVTHMEPVS